MFLQKISSLLFLAIALTAFVTALEADLHGSCGDCCDEGPCGDCALCWCSYTVPQAEPVVDEIPAFRETALIAFTETSDFATNHFRDGIDRPPRA